ncbi:MAG: hypothetical protein DMD76_12190 [Candidatus Rokuibacteriota bacterium]|nr:MAG: hypothetical protein DMD76_12190 [Candidatus Rokubacteria bacterium]
MVTATPERSMVANRMITRVPPRSLCAPTTRALARRLSPACGGRCTTRLWKACTPRRAIASSIAFARSASASGHS